MAKDSKIEWTDHTFNPWVGCTKVSPACDHCYAEGWAKRTGQSHLWSGERRRTTASNWQQPIKWNKEAERDGVRRKVFCASLADVFDNKVPERWRDDLWHRIEQTPALDWLLLTKRPQNIAKMLPTAAIGATPWGDGWPNVWLGTTAENQAEADRRIPHLLLVPAAKRFISAEPLLGSLDLRPWLPGDSGCDGCDDSGGGPNSNHCMRDDIPRDQQCPCKFEVRDYPEGPLDADGVPSRIHDVKVTIDWVIAGGESGPGARPMHPDWVRNLRNQCTVAGVPFFFKQWGEFKDGSDFAPDAIAVLSDGRIVEPTQEAMKVADRIDPVKGATMMRRVGKKAAGALLDGREWREMPHG